MMVLVDTNLFLEILLDQEKKEECKRVLLDNAGTIAVSVFSLHSIGVILFRYGKEQDFSGFLDDMIRNGEILSLSPIQLREIGSVKTEHGLDFDDAYQYSVAKRYGLTLITMDTDFGKVSGIEVTLV